MWGSSVAKCITAYDVCNCTVQTSAYNPENKQCEPNKCTIASGDHICIGENKAICMSNTWPTSGTSGETLCAHYDCMRHQQCAAGSVCDIDTFACRCANPTHYFDTADNTCKDGCTGLNAHTGVCIGSNKALCYKGYTSPSSGGPSAHNIHALMQIPPVEAMERVIVGHALATRNTEVEQHMLRKYLHPRNSLKSECMHLHQWLAG